MKNQVDLARTNNPAFDAHDLLQRIITKSVFNVGKHRVAEYLFRWRDEMTNGPRIAVPDALPDAMVDADNIKAERGDCPIKVVWVKDDMLLRMKNDAGELFPIIHYDIQFIPDADAQATMIELARRKIMFAFLKHYNIEPPRIIQPNPN